MSKQNFQFNTLAIHAGTTPDPVTGSRQVPIHQTSSYQFKDSDHAANLFALKEFGYIYTRLHNPTVKALEDRVTALEEGGIFSVATSSGHAAQLVALLNVLQQGDEIASAQKLYGGTLNQFSKTFNQFGWSTKFFDESNPETLKDVINEKTKVVFIESVTNPNGDIVDIEKIAEIAHAHGLPLFVDNTVASPYLVNPLKWGADIVIHSTTKYLSGNGTSIGGIIVDGGKFDWAKSNKYPLLTEPDSSYNNISFSTTFGELGFSVRAIAVGLRDIGTPQSPFNAFLTLNGIETLPLRIERHSYNAEKLAEWLNKHPKIEEISHPKFNPKSNKTLTDKYFTKGATGVFTFKLKNGTLEKGKKVVESLKLFSHVANIGDAKSLIIHPASTTHSQLSEEQKKLSGADAALLRVSVGIENIDDIIADLNQALENI